MDHLITNIRTGSNRSKEEISSRKKLYSQGFIGNSSSNLIHSRMGSNEFGTKKRNIYDNLGHMKIHDNYQNISNSDSQATRK